MTFKKLIDGKKITYLLLDDFVEKLSITSEVDLEPNEVDVLTSKILELGAKEGILATEKGEITYTLIPKKWEEINEH